MIGTGFGFSERIASRGRRSARVLAVLGLIQTITIRAQLGGEALDGHKAKTPVCSAFAGLKAFFVQARSITQAALVGTRRIVALVIRSNWVVCAASRKDTGKCDEQKPRNS